jgi:lipopolysaccharide export system permease protein
MLSWLTILDRYIIKKYLTTFGFVVLIVTLIACVIDVSEKIEEFTKNTMTKREIFLDYYLNFIPHINILLFPMYALIAVIFFTSRMASDSEVISMLNAGMSFKRLLRPYMIGAAVIASIHLLFNHFLVPMGNKTRLAFEHKYIATHQDKGKQENVHLFIDPNTEVFIRYFSKPDSSATDFRILKYVNGDIRTIIKAQRAEWQGYPNKWKLRTIEKRTFDGLNETIQTNLPDLDTTINLTKDDFVRFINQNEMLTSSELMKEINKLTQRGMGNTKSYEIEVNRRTSEVFTIFILTLIGVALSGRKVRGGVGLHLALGISIGAIFAFLSKFSATFALSPDVSALVGVWIPNMIFGVVAWYLVSRAQS